MEYGVNVSNKFAFLSGDEDSHDPEELIEQATKKRASALKTAATTKKTAVEKKVTISAAVNSVNKENVDIRNQKRTGQQGGHGFERKNVRNTNARRPDDNNNGENRPPRTNRLQKDGPRDGGRHNNVERQNNPRRFNGPRPQRTEGGNVSDENQVSNDRVNRPPSNRNYRRNDDRSNRPPRTDRISGSDKTGIRSVPKKEGYGRGNWGTEKDEFAGETETPVNGSLNQSADATEHVDEEKSEEVEVEETPRELTLEEWKAQHKSEEPKFNTRKPGEGADKKLYQKLVPLKKTIENKKSVDTEEDVQVKREPREKAILDIEVSFNDPQRNRGSRNFRDDRARGGDDRRGGDRRQGNFRQGGNYRQSGAPSQKNRKDFNFDAAAFPSL